MTYYRHIIYIYHIIKCLNKKRLHFSLNINNNLEAHCKKMTKFIMPNKTKVMSDDDIFREHICFFPYQDISRDNKNRNKSSATSTSSKSNLSRRSKTLSSDGIVNNESGEVKLTGYQEYSTNYEPDNSTLKNVDSSQIIPGNVSGKFLDWLSDCFWKCSSGCQELPTLK